MRRGRRLLCPPGAPRGPLQESGFWRGDQARGGNWSLGTRLHQGQEPVRGPEESVGQRRARTAPRELWEEDGRRGGGGEPGGVASAGAGSQDSNLRLRTKGHGRP